MVKETEQAHRKEDGELIQKRKQKVINNLILGILQAVMLHVSALQSDLTLFSQAFKGNTAATARALASTNAISGLAGLFLNQIGGKLSDSLGRKPFFLIGPLVNIACSMAILRNSGSAAVLSITRVLRSIFITFSGTVMCSASLADICSGAEMALNQTRLQVAVGIAVVAGPYIESAALKLSNGNPLAPFKIMMALSLVQLLHYAGGLPETLGKRKDLQGFSEMLASLNPFAFLKIYFGKNGTLKKLLTIQTLQFCVDGKVTSDLFQLWAKNNLQWKAETIRDFVALLGSGCDLWRCRHSPISSQEIVNLCLQYFGEPLCWDRSCHAWAQRARNLHVEWGPFPCSWCQRW